jgi:hypothetical protein
MTIRGVAPARGWYWISGAFGLFRRNPLIWLVLNLILAGIGWLLGKLPAAGYLMFYLLAPIFFAGIMAACREVDSGGDVEIGHLFRGFRQNTTQLVILGAILLAGELLIAAVTESIGGAEYREIRSGAAQFPDPATMPEEVRSRVLTAMLVGLALYLPLGLALWFSPALVMLDNQPGLRAAVLSLAAGARNILPMLVYSTISSVLFVLAMIPMGVGLVLWIPIVVLSMYTSYRDIFVPIPATAPAGTVAPPGGDEPDGR